MSDFIDDQAPPSAAEAASAPSSEKSRRGYALPLAVFVMAILSITLAAGFASTATEIVTNNAQRAESRAYVNADNGLQEFIARRAEPGFCQHCGSPPDDTLEWTHVTLATGYADVVARRVRKNVGFTTPAIYLISSAGVDSVTSVSGSSIGTYGHRTVAQFAYWSPKAINILSGWTSLSGLGVNGKSATLSGADNCGKNATVAGVAGPSGTMAGNDSTVATGNPKVLDLGTQAHADSAVNIDWNGIVNGGNVLQIPASHINATTIPQIVVDSSNMAGLNYWPIIHITNGPNPQPNGPAGTVSIPSGQGTLIIDGNATFSGSGTWKGIILVGGNYTSNGNNTVYGAVTTGLNAKLLPKGATGVQDAVGNGNKTYQYDSCNVASATAAFGFYTVMPNAWMDNYVTW